ncbi:FG-GAP repeat domain-containing protein [Streptomyces fulvoviolaceus]|uniref:FG-GAP repeat domain-containing protein n=1 Tax=Streptomyces fulvoviolaceus TaxID=285535 RepID=UPI0004CC12BD|nr:VCBS repeat-containing protein [Streptomyces fulvoviolaceus]
MSESVSHRTRRTFTVALALLATVCASAVSLAGPAQATTSVRQDFNGDGYEDLAVGSSSAKVNGKSGAGYVAVLFGSASGLKTSTKKVYTQASSGIPGTVEANDHFGFRLAAADLDEDGYTDLVVDVDNEQWKQNGIARDGSRTVLWGSRGGLTSGTVLPALSSSPYRGGLNTLLTGDFDGDGHQDLAATDFVRFGPFERTGAAASVQKGVDFLEGSRMVTAVAAGDTDGDGITDLVALTRPYDRDEDHNYTYSLFHLRGSRSGLQPSTALDGGEFSSDEPWERGLAVGDLDGDHRAETVAGGGNALEIIPGTADGPDATARRVVDQDTLGVPGADETGDGFGDAIAVGDVDGDGYGDILAGNPTEDLAGPADAGTFAVVPGGPDGPTGAGTVVLSQNSASVSGTAEARDLFGYGVHLVDGNGDGRVEPVVGAVGENAYEGAVWVFRSTSAGVTAKGSFLIGAGTLGTVASSARLGAVFPR